MADHPAQHEVTHEECPDAETAAELQALLDHLAKYGDPEHLAGHLVASHSMQTRHAGDPLPDLREMHGTAHDNAVQAAFRSLPGCADAVVS